MRTYNDGTGDGIRATEEAHEQCSLLSIEAWREREGWQWNSWHRLASVPVAIADLKPRRLLAWLREFGYLPSASAGRVEVYDDGYNVVIQRRGTGEPFLAVAYGEVQP